VSKPPPTWALSKVETQVAEDHNGVSKHATFVCGYHSVTFLVIGIKAASRSEAYTFADWITADGSTDRTNERNKHAARVNGSYCPDIVIEMLGAGLRNGSISDVSPNRAGGR
jgi:hypothetical protein